MGWTVTCAGDRAAVEVFRERDDSGLFKAYLRGPEGRFLLGTLAPEGNHLMIRRQIPIDRLRSCGAWPILAADTALEFTFPRRPQPPKGWHLGDKVTGFTDTVLQGCAEDLTPAFTAPWLGGMKIAYPYRKKRPFPLPPLFCLARAEKLAGEMYIVYYFREDGTPCLPNQKVL